MIGRSSQHRSFTRGSQIPPQDAIVAPGASYAVARTPIARDHGAHGKPAMEMPARWKPQNGFHSALEISHTTRDSHISTADHLFVSQEEDEEEDVRHASRRAMRWTEIPPGCPAAPLAPTRPARTPPHSGPPRDVAAARGRPRPSADHPWRRGYEEREAQRMWQGADR